MIKAKVINKFQEKEHDNHTYKPGDVYPAEGYEATEERVAFLAEQHPEYKKKFLSDVQKAEKADKKDKKGKGKDKE